MSDYFCFYPFIPKNLPQQIDTFLSKVEIPYNDEHLILTLGTIVSKKPNFLSIALDIEYVMVIPEKISFDDISGWLDKAHDIIEIAFESCITDKTKEHFQEVNNANSISK